MYPISFVDRDMYMWYTGLGIGHLKQNSATDALVAEQQAHSDDEGDEQEDDSPLLPNSEHQTGADDVDEENSGEMPEEVHYDSEGDDDNRYASDQSGEDDGYDVL